LCGPSSQEKQLASQQAGFSASLQKDYAQTFAANQEILNQLNTTLQPIVEAGPNQQGYSAAESAALNTQATETNAQGYNDTLKAASAREDAAGGGTSFLPSGVNAQINAEIGSAAESNLSREKLGITQANYAQGNANWRTALAGEAGVASAENPPGYAQAGTSANSQAFNEANTINQQSNQEFGDIAGSIVGIAAAPFTGGTSLVGLAKNALSSGPSASSQSSDWFNGGNPIS